MSQMITFTTPPCQVCGDTSEMELDAERVREWQEGGHIQTIFPELTANQRELMVSGTHPKCWEELFAEEDE